MATAKHLPRRDGSRIWRTAFWLFLIAVLVLAWFWQPINARAVAATSYGARVACGCRYIAGRDLSDCRKDFVSGMGLVMLSEDADDRAVTAWLPPLSSQTATYRKGRGCVPEAWAD